MPVKNTTKGMKIGFGITYAILGIWGGLVAYNSLRVGTILKNCIIGVFAGLIIFFILKVFLLDKDYEGEERRKQENPRR